MIAIEQALKRMTDLTPHIVEFSTDGIAEHDRVAVWREYYGQVMMRVDLEPPRDMTFEARNRCLSLPGLQLMESSSSPVKVSRGGRYLADGNDDVVLAIARSGADRHHFRRTRAEPACRRSHRAERRRAASFHRVSTANPSRCGCRARCSNRTVVSVEDALMRPISPTAARSG